MGSDKLIDALLRKPPSAFRAELVKNALLGRYHDFKSTLATPKVQLVADLKRYGFDDLARRAMRGEYDDEPDAEDTADVARYWHSLSGDEQRNLAEIYERLTGIKPPSMDGGDL